MKKLILLFMMLLLLVGCTATPNNNAATQIDLETLIQKINSNETFVVLFEMDGCPWCVEALPVYKDVATKNDVKAYYLNFSDEQSKTTYQIDFGILTNYLRDNIEFDDEGYPIFYVPAAFFFKNGNVVNIHTGIVSAHNPSVAKLTKDQTNELIALYQDGFDLLK